MSYDCPVPGACASLIPYALTWSIGGGGEWRFTQHAYPSYLVLAAWAAVAVGRWVSSAMRGRTLWLPHATRQRYVQVALIAAVVGVAVAWDGAMPLLVADEVLRAGEAATITAGDRDSWTFQGSWSQPVRGGVPFRVAQATLSSLRVPVRGRSEFWLTLRIDPAETADLERQPRVAVYLNRRLVAQLRLARDPGRIGSYRIRITDHPDRMFSRLDLVASHTVPAREAGSHFASLDPAAVAFRLWYVQWIRRSSPDTGGPTVDPAG